MSRNGKSDAGREAMSVHETARKATEYLSQRPEIQAMARNLPELQAAYQKVVEGLKARRFQPSLEGEPVRFATMGLYNADGTFEEEEYETATPSETVSILTRAMRHARGATRRDLMLAIAREREDARDFWYPLARRNRKLYHDFAEGAISSRDYVRALCSPLDTGEGKGGVA